MPIDSLSLYQHRLDEPRAFSVSPSIFESYEEQSDVGIYCKLLIRNALLGWTTVKKHSRVSPFNPFNFGHYTNLRKLSITRCRRMHDRFHGQDEDIMKLVGLLEATDTCNNLHTLTVRIMGFYESFAGEGFLVPDVHLAGPSVWEELDRVVASSRFPALRHFSLEIISTDIEQAPSGKFDVSEMERLTKECFDRSFMRTKALQRVELEWVVKEIYFLDLDFYLGD